MDITREHLRFLEESKVVFANEPRRETHCNHDLTLIALRYGDSRDCIRIFQLDGEVAFFSNIIDNPTSYPIMRSEVHWFASLMESQLRAHDHKGGWLSESDAVLMSGLKKNLLLACNPEKSIQEVRRRLVNIANFAMMIADKLRTDR
ncbi:hypothetical protein [Cohnella yongneupensis]|uniref:Uncharacterized protein n=1 Tax=Cohnella yongneupensis TaxID=425006 RepID=A0ABW0QV81_9BACL